MESQAETDYESESSYSTTSGTSVHTTDSETIDEDEATKITQAVKMLNTTLSRILQKNEEDDDKEWVEEAVALWVELNKMDAKLLKLLQIRAAAKKKISLNKIK